MNVKPLLLIFSMSCGAQAQTWRLESSSKQISLGHEASLVIKQIVGPSKTEMKLVFFDEKHCLMQVASNADSKTAKPLDEIGRTRQAVAVCNGGYFNAGGDFGPAGLEVSNGNRTDQFRGDRGWVGALIVRQGKASLILENEFQDTPDISDFVQCSPWLIDKDRIAPVLLTGQDVRNHRTFIVSDGAGRWAIGVCKGVGLLDLARALVTPSIITEMKVKRALNLDGGPSTGLWCRNEDGREQFEKPGWAVRNAIVVLPRDSK